MRRQPLCKSPALHSFAKVARLFEYRDTEKAKLDSLLAEDIDRTLQSLVKCW